MGKQAVVEFHSVTKRFGGVSAVEDLSFTVRPGRIVGILGRNGAGKSTSLRVLLGLARPTEGSATVFGQAYQDLPHAARRIGVSMDSIGPTPGTTGRRDLSVWARTLGLPPARVDEVIDLVDLTEGADRKVKGYSTGMKQRLALATALLADPELLVLDEPVNGLDPDGIRWLRELLRSLAAEGRTVLLSSHLLAEVEQTVDDVVILQRTLRYAGALEDLTTGGADRLEDRFFELAGTRSGRATE
ncbi:MULTISPECIES: ATP-binding cassette domain-containing protein [unclassified Streptomyces]|uniref:ATP-binding cassette domain-containing protein n=1 Tax=unclassified Streptomyces TaxID=2593676 RepID=UPI001660A6CC|nr:MULTISPECIES: ATP-binding cassette domain-containing protein [unclassified Streptomyces]MBD0706877.1 ABC transporter ATP-binding protein [Streptomyces sp. CBMA291]MBD0715013.1 ABC transporter ATP-binding protein [Streptomyces sp. CBMA370]